METFTLFDEYQTHAITSDERHAKRMNLEPLIFDILKSKYSRQLAASWASTTIKKPSETDKTVVIIEARIHPNLQFLLHNVAYYCKDWAITFVCSDKNLKYCQELAEHHKENITFLPLFKFTEDRETARGEYNRLLKSAELYEAIPCDNMLIVQTDSYLRKHLPDSILKYDYVASPFSWEKEHAGGGMSFRKKAAMLEIVKSSKRYIESEDVFMSTSVQDMGYKMPKWEEGLRYFCESTLYAQTCGVHQWWTFLRNVPGAPQCKQVFHALLTLEL